MSDGDKALLLLLPQLTRLLGQEAFRNARAKGFYRKEPSVGDRCALTHGEVSEVLEAFRDGNPKDSKCPQFSAMEVEYADVLLRIADACHRYKFDLGGAILAKLAYNKTRPKKHGGKKI